MIVRIIIFLILTHSANSIASQLVKIGVLSHRGDAATLQNWSPMAEYLTEAVSEYQFEVLPLDFDEIDPYVAQGKVDFLLVNPGIYVTMEVRHRISRIATLNKRVSGEKFNVFAGVIFTRSSRSDINSLKDLKAKELMAVDAISLGGYQMGWREIQRAGLKLDDLKSISFGGIHDEVVNAVLKGAVDAGTVRTGILESMADSGRIDISKIKVLGQKSNVEFPALHSTQLYPEWPFSKLQHTSNDLAQSVAVALLKMSTVSSAQMNNYVGWTVPLEYQPVHDLMKELNLPPYDQVGKFTLTDAIEKYWGLVTISFVFVLILAIMTTWVARLNRALSRSKQRLEQQHSLILDSVADGIYGVDLDGNSTFVNKAMEKITGWKSDQLIGKNQHKILHHTKADGSPHPDEECPVYLTFKDDKSRYISEDTFWKADGSGFPVEYSCTPLKDENKNTVGSVVVFRDISLRKQAEEAARKHQAELAHIARLSTMGEMASGIAHELNQPLTAIAASADASVRMLDANYGNKEKLIDVLETIGLQAHRAGGIIQQLRQFVRKEEAERSPVDVNSLVEEVVLLLKHDIELENVRLELRLQESLPLVEVQPIQIDQVILNLAKNALEAMSEEKLEKKVLTITSMQQDAFIAVSVSDTGQGIDAKTLDHLFTPFVTTKGKGMGLGLSISEGIIRAHDGEMQVESSEHGAVFTFRLPVNL